MRINEFRAAGQDMLDEYRKATGSPAPSSLYDTATMYLVRMAQYAAATGTKPSPEHTEKCRAWTVGYDIPAAYFMASGGYAFSVTHGLAAMLQLTDGEALPGFVDLPMNPFVILLPTPNDILPGVRAILLHNSLAHVADHELSRIVRTAHAAGIESISDNLRREVSASPVLADMLARTEQARRPASTLFCVMKDDTTSTVIFAPDAGDLEDICDQAGSEDSDGSGRESLRFAYKLAHYINTQRPTDDSEREVEFLVREPRSFKGPRTVTVGRNVKLPSGLMAAARAQGAERGPALWKLAQRFMVRGHYRDQPHGPGRAQTKTIWIQPHWKGPEDAVVAKRDYDVDTLT